MILIVSTILSVRRKIKIRTAIFLTDLNHKIIMREQKTLITRTTTALNAITTEEETILLKLRTTVKKDKIR